ncbi:MAG: NAD(P)-dependent alcohol dehydrogenase [Acidimicrobiia bacterium]|nr:NAD(P)-dependent alcohol dehydrogenase [Acidimicrobiia bacterium]
MTAVTARTYGTEDVLAVEEIPVPNPGDGEVLIQVAASSLNALDWHFVTGTPYFLRLMAGLVRPKRSVPGADVAGTVVAVGSSVNDIAVGDRVFGETDGGGCGQYAATKASTLALLPDGVTFEAAAATPVAGLTALQALRTHADVRPGDSVLINGAAGGVGTFAVQIAKALGATVTAVCSGRNVEMVGALGADRVIDYTTEDLAAGGDRYDVMMDNVGNRTTAECRRVLAPSARYVIVSGPKENRWLGPVPLIVRRALAFRRTDHSFHQFTASPNRADLELLAAMLADGRIVPQIDRVVGLDGVAAGLAEIGSAHARAKIVVRPA